MKKIFLLIGLSWVTTSSYAFFCPTNLQQINFGDSLEQVTQQCGKPNTERKILVNPDDAPQEWVFNNNDGTAQVRLMFIKQHISSITENGMPIATTNICGGNIAVNDSMDAVKLTCPAPTLINKDNNNLPKEDEKDFSTGTVEFGYQTSPPVTLVFTDGKLTGKK